MAVSGKLSSHTEAYWRDEYQVSQADIDLATSMILQEGNPVPVEKLAGAIITEKQSREEAVAAQLSRETRVYRPMDGFEVGQRLMFTEMDMAEGRVTAKRPGNNPRYGEFEVIAVAFGDGDDGETIEFAAAMAQPHHLNRAIEELVTSGEEGLTGDEAIEAYAPIVVAKLNAVFEADEDMVPFADKWFLNDLLPQIDAGYLNLAEAAIYEAGEPVTAREILARLALDVAGSEAAQLFALNRALEADERFDDLGGEGAQRWYLRALEPEAIFETPAVLANPISATAGEPLGLTLIDVIEELGDDLDEIGESSARALAPKASFKLIFPHLYAGTMPALRGLLAALPEASGDHYPITVTDQRRRKGYTAWVVPDKGFICGLEALYEAADMAVGAELEAAVNSAGDGISLEYAAPRSRRSEWLKAAAVAEGRLTLEMKPATLGVRCDNEAVIIAEDPEAISGLMASPKVREAAIGDLIRRSFLELAKLSGQGLVHVKALYMVVNMHRRCGAAPIMSHLTRQAAYDPMGDGLWAYDGSLEGQVYTNLDDMRERPLSNRNERLRDQAVPYQGI